MLVGVYGVMTQFVALRRREMAIRIALGAAPSGVVGVVVRRALGVVSGGLAIGVVGAVASARLLRSVLFGVSELDPFTFAAVVATLATVSVLASYLPARAAAAVDANVILRSE